MPGNKSDDPLLAKLPNSRISICGRCKRKSCNQSLLVATGADQLSLPLKEQEKLKSDWMQQFVVGLEMTKVRRPRPLTGTIPQALMLMNGDLVKKVIIPRRAVFLQTIPGNMKPVEKVQYLFEAALARRPTPGEITVANQLLGREGRAPRLRQGKKAAVVDPTSSALQDIFWAVLNSNEFILQH